MKRPQFVFRPTLSNPDYRKAWERLQSVPRGQRKDFFVRAILADEKRDTFKQMIRDVIREELTHSALPQEPTKPTTEKEVPKQTLDFFASLCD